MLSMSALGRNINKFQQTLPQIHSQMSNLRGFSKVHRIFYTADELKKGPQEDVKLGKKAKLFREVVFQAMEASKKNKGVPVTIKFPKTSHNNPFIAANIAMLRIFDWRAIYNPRGFNSLTLDPSNKKAIFDNEENDNLAK